MCSVAAVGPNGARYCPATTCIDLQQYSFMNNNACICNSPILVTLATEAGDARRHFLAALVGELFVMAPLITFGTLGKAVMHRLCYSENPTAVVRKHMPPKFFRGVFAI